MAALDSASIQPKRSLIEPPFIVNASIHRAAFDPEAAPNSAFSALSLKCCKPSWDCSDEAPRKSPIYSNPSVIEGMAAVDILKISTMVRWNKQGQYHRGRQIQEMHQFRLRLLCLCASVFITKLQADLVVNQIEHFESNFSKQLSVCKYFRQKIV